MGREKWRMTTQRRPPATPPGADGEDVMHHYQIEVAKTATTLEQKHFRFFDLPKELRLIIYELALAHDRLDGISRNTALLRTSKEVHGEGADIATKVGTFGVKITGKQPGVAWYRSQGGLSWEWSPRVVEVAGDCQASIDDKVSCSDILTGASSLRFPPQARKLSSVRVILDTEATPVSDQAEYLSKMQRVLYGLVAFFKDSEARSFKVILSPKMETAPADIQKSLLYPLAKLSLATKVEFINVAAGVADHIQALRCFDYVQYNPLTQYSRLLSLRGALENKFAHLPKGCKEAYAKIQRMLKRASSSSSMLDENSDRKLMDLINIMLEFEALPQVPTKVDFRNVHKKYVRKRD